MRLTLQGKSAALLHGQRLPQDWWSPKRFAALPLPAALQAQLQLWQRVALSVDAELQALTAPWQAAAPAGLPAGLGAMTWELITREVGDWHRFRGCSSFSPSTGR